MSELENIETTLLFIRNNADPLAEAKSDRIYLEQFRKSQKALLFIDAPEGTIQSKESYAYAHAEYQIVLSGLREAVKKEEKLKWMMIAAQARIEVWRTEQANARYIDKAHT